MRVSSFCSVLGTFLAGMSVMAEEPSGLAAPAELVQGLPWLCDFEMRRITSADPTGGNKDNRELLPGQIAPAATEKK